MVRENVGPVAAFNKVISVSKLPKTRSGKISRGSMASLASNSRFSVSALQSDFSTGVPESTSLFQIPPTIEDATAYDELLTQLQSIDLALDPQIVNRSDFN